MGKRGFEEFSSDDQDTESRALKEYKAEMQLMQVIAEGANGIASSHLVMVTPIVTGEDADAVASHLALVTPVGALVDSERDSGFDDNLFVMMPAVTEENAGIAAGYLAVVTPVATEEANDIDDMHTDAGSTGSLEMHAEEQDEIESERDDASIDAEYASVAMASNLAIQEDGYESDYYLGDLEEEFFIDFSQMNLTNREVNSDVRDMGRFADGVISLYEEVNEAEVVNAFVEPQANVTMTSTFGVEHDVMAPVASIPFVGVAFGCMAAANI